MILKTPPPSVIMLENYTLRGSEASSDWFSSLNQKGASLCCLLMFLAVPLALVPPSDIQTQFCPLSRSITMVGAFALFRNWNDPSHQKSCSWNFIPRLTLLRGQNNTRVSVCVFHMVSEFPPCSDWRVSAFEKILFRNSLPQFPFHLPLSIFPKAFYFSISGTNMLMEYVLWLLFLVHNHDKCAPYLS